MGYAAVNGVVNQNSSLSPITIPVGVSEGAQATQNFSLTTNLNSGATVGDELLIPGTGIRLAGTEPSGDGELHEDSDQYVELFRELPAGDASGTPVNNTGTLTFDTSGNLD